jgi:hypothetical protein
MRNGGKRKPTTAVHGKTGSGTPRPRETPPSHTHRAEWSGTITNVFTIGDTIMSTQYQVTIQMNDDTVGQLGKDQFSLYAFKAVSGPGGGVPLVWFSTTDFSEQTVVTWTESYEAYTSTNTQLTPNAKISASASYAINLGEQLNVTTPEGTGVVVEGSDPQAITIDNLTSTEFSCGISQQQADGSFQMLCAFPLIGQGEDELVPIEQVFLMFSTTPVNTGTVIEQSVSSGVMVDLTGQSQMSVTFDIHNGWTAAPGLTLCPPNTQLVPLLINPAPSLAAR